MAVRTHKLASLGLLALVAATSFACGDAPTGPWRYQKVAITPNGFFPGGRGATERFQAAVVNNAGEVLSSDGFRWRWSSSNPAVLTIDADGVGTAVGVGTAEVQAEAAGLKGLVTVTVSQVPTAFALVEGGKQSGVVGKALPTPISVRLVDAGGSPIAGDTVVFSASGGGTVGTRSTVTGADGLAKTTWQLGTRTADVHRLTATRGAITLDVPATALPDAPANRTATGTNQSGWGLEAADSSIAVVITDKHGNPVPDLEVAWRVTSGGGAIVPFVPKTNSLGRAWAAWTLGDLVGAQTATAEVPGLQPVIFNAVAKENAVVSGTVQTAPGALTAPAASAARPTRAPGAAAAAAEYVPGDWIVTFDGAAVSAPPAAAPGAFPGGMSPAAVAAVEASIQARVAAADAAIAPPFVVAGVSPATLAARIRVGEPGDFEAVGTALRAQPGVRSVERNALIRLREPARSLASVPAPVPPVQATDLYYPLQGWSYDLIGLDQGWKLTTGSTTVIVAVVDDGIRPTHSDLAANLTNDGYDFVTDLALPGCSGGTFSNAGDGGGYDSDPTIPSSMDYDAGCVGATEAIGGHGLHVAGTIAAAAGSTGAVGVAPKVKIRPVRVLGVTGVGTAYDIAQGILYAAGLPADNGAGLTVMPATRAQIINLSLGGPGPSAVVTAAVQAASAAGSLLIAAAGNDGVSDPFYPAALPEVISVSAVGPSGGLAPYSNWGPTIDIAAPGGDVSGGATHQVLSTLWNFSTGTETWNYYQGTSMAAPHVSGVAALLLSKEPTLTAAQLRDRLLKHATPAGDPQLYGAGIVNAFASLTQGAGFRRETYVRLTDATTGATLGTVKAATDGGYRISHLPIGGSFRVFAGLDEEGDGTIGTPGRSFGAFGGSAGTTVVAPTTRIYEASFTVGMPNESGGNSSSPTADYVPAGGYVIGQLASGLEDWYVSDLPAGTYTFGTTGLRGGCGVAGQANTRIELYDQAGSLVAQNDDGSGFDYCGKITRTVSAGRYWVKVQSSATISFGGAGQTTGAYRYSVRSGG